LIVQADKQVRTQRSLPGVNLVVPGNLNVDYLNKFLNVYTSDFCRQIMLKRAITLCGKTRLGYIALEL
jgi:hypothetical protein